MADQRILLAGNAAAACRCLDLCVEAVGSRRVLAIAPSGGARHTWQASLAEAARAADVPVIEPDDINAADSVEQILSWAPDIVLSIGYTQLFRRSLLGTLAVPVLNFHPSLLPRHRGVAPLVWAMVEGDTSTGVTIHHVDAGVDTGPVILQRSLPIHPDETGYELHQRAAHLTESMCAQLLRSWLRDGEVPAGYAQSGPATVHRQRDATLNDLDLGFSATRIRDTVRALCPPFPGARLLVDGRAYVLAEVELGPATLARRAPRTIEVDGSHVTIHALDQPLVVRSWYDGSRFRTGSELADRLGSGVHL